MSGWNAVKWSIDHLRDPKVRTKSLCGQGYLWPSTISLKDQIEDVNCDKCIRRNNEV